MLKEKTEEMTDTGAGRCYGYRTRGICASGDWHTIFSKFIRDGSLFREDCLFNAGTFTPSYLKKLGEEKIA